MDWTTHLYMYTHTMNKRKTKYISSDCYLYDKWNIEYSFYWYDKLQSFIRTKNYCYKDQLLFHFLSSNMNVTWDLVQSMPSKPWNYALLSENPNINWETVQENPNINWDYNMLSKNPNITWEIIQETPRKNGRIII